MAQTTEMMCRQLPQDLRRKIVGDMYRMIHDNPEFRKARKFKHEVKDALAKMEDPTLDEPALVQTFMNVLHYALQAPYHLPWRAITKLVQTYDPTRFVNDEPPATASDFYKLLEALDDHMNLDATPQEFRDDMISACIELNHLECAIFLITGSLVALDYLDGHLEAIDIDDAWNEQDDHWKRMRIGDDLAWSLMVHGLDKDSVYKISGVMFVDYP